MTDPREPDRHTVLRIVADALGDDDGGDPGDQAGELGDGDDQEGTT